MIRIEKNVQTGEVKEIEVTPEELALAAKRAQENPVKTVTALDRMLADPEQRAKLKALLSE